jgi:hypothetical protein
LSQVLRQLAHHRVLLLLWRGGVLEGTATVLSRELQRQQMVCVFHTILVAKTAASQSCYWPGMWLRWRRLLLDGGSRCEPSDNIVHLQILQVSAALLDNMRSNLLGQPKQILIDLVLTTLKVMPVERGLRAKVIAGRIFGFGA